MSLQDILTLLEEFPDITFALLNLGDSTRSFPAGQGDNFWRVGNNKLWILFELRIETGANTSLPADTMIIDGKRMLNTAVAAGVSKSFFGDTAIRTANVAQISMPIIVREDVNLRLSNGGAVAENSSVFFYGYVTNLADFVKEHAAKVL